MNAGLDPLCYLC